MARPRIRINEDVEQKASRLLLSLVPKDGAPIGNSTLRQKFLQQSKARLNQNFGEEVYWQVRNGLIQTRQFERGRGKGGSVRLLGDTLKPTRKRVTRGYRKETDLYEPFHQTIRTQWVQ